MTRLKLLNIYLKEGLREITRVCTNQGMDVFLDRFEGELSSIIDLVKKIERIDGYLDIYNKEDLKPIIAWLMEKNDEIHK